MTFILNHLLNVNGLSVNDLLKTGPEARARTCNLLLDDILQHLRNLALESASAGHIMFTDL